ncbi:hypothetical protein J27TS7_06210 [Paenibacillus dendritiformis]|nr:hypothetical protein J27TS7_06210 [Paenibacillus dendritiformis]
MVQWIYVKTHRILSTINYFMKVGELVEVDFVIRRQREAVMAAVE